MTDFVFNIAKGRWAELYNRVESNDPAPSALVVVLIKAGEAQATMEDYDDLGTLLAQAGNTECDFTNYARKVLTDTELAAFPAPDDTNNRVEVTIPAQTFVNAGGATNNNIVGLLICYDADTAAGTDSNIVPLFHLDYVETTTGSSITATPDPSGVARAS